MYLILLGSFMERLWIPWQRSPWDYTVGWQRGSTHSSPPGHLWVQHCSPDSWHVRICVLQMFNHFIYVYENLLFRVQITLLIFWTQITDLIYICRKRWILFPPETGGLKPTRVPYEESSVYSELNFYCPNNLDVFNGMV